MVRTRSRAEADDSPGEAFQPISVKPPSSNPWAFRLRCVVDLQLATIVKHLRPALGSLDGKVLDVGAGQSPWRSWLPERVHYFGLDIANAAEFGMSESVRDVTYYDGGSMPFADGTFDAVLCVEVMEHASDPELLVSEMFRVLKPGGTLLLTVPWSARLHHLPHDYHRFTRNRLRALLSGHGFADIRIAERGSDVGAIANKLTVLSLRLFSPGQGWRLVFTMPFGVITGLLAAAFVCAAHAADRLGWGAAEDPLGYFLQATRSIRRPD
ncbi:class I SAM-dependent methyltransferase [Bordetella genomosp. 8]|nr:class I SAM-dependent methyltransferase [Bordetella genomosp. 8]